MSVEPVCLCLNQRRTFSVSRSRNGRLYLVHDSKQVISIDRDAWETVSISALRQIFDIGHFCNSARHPVFIVFAENDDRQFPNGSKVQRLVETALIRCTVPKKTNRHIVRFFQLCVQRGTYRNRDSAADDAVVT